MARAWNALREWRQVLSDPAIEPALERLGGIDSIERLDGGAVFRAWSGRRYVEFRKLYREPAEPTLGAEVGIAMQASDIMLWPRERGPQGPSRATFRDPRQAKSKQAKEQRARRRIAADDDHEDMSGFDARTRRES